MPRKARNADRVKTTSKDLKLNTAAAAGGYAASDDARPEA